MQFDLKINTYENVTSVIREDDDFLIHTDKRGKKHNYRAKSVIIANGSTDTPRLLDIPGEQLPHVTHYFEEPHKYFKQRVLVVGGRNSAVEAALRCHQCGADVVLSHRGSEFDQKSIKYWLLPEILALSARGDLPIYRNTVPKEIHTHTVTLESLKSGSAFDVDADFVLLMVGYLADMTLFKTAGVMLEGPQDKPVYDESTMETNVPSLYVAGTAIAGSQQTYNVFMENCHIHVERIMASLTGTRIDDDLIEYDHPES
ncbi:NAD(P)-binding domain-containing protein [Candidatus Omnitrophota bacterium]